MDCRAGARTLPRDRLRQVSRELPRHASGQSAEKLSGPSLQRLKAFWFSVSLEPLTFLLI